MLPIKYFRILITGYWEDLINFPLLSLSPWRNKFEFHKTQGPTKFGSADLKTNVKSLKTDVKWWK